MHLRIFVPLIRSSELHCFVGGQFDVRGWASVIENVLCDRCRHYHLRYSDRQASSHGVCMEQREEAHQRKNPSLRNIHTF